MYKKSFGNHPNSYLEIRTLKISMINPGADPGFYVGVAETMKWGVLAPTKDDRISVRDRPLFWTDFTILTTPVRIWVGGWLKADRFVRIARRQFKSVHFKMIFLYF